MDDKGLILEALAALEKSYSPYSGFMVGAALLAKSGKVYCGCNIENAAFSPTNCAERTAFFKAVSEGEQQFEAIAITGRPRGGEPVLAYPCGVCRQVMMEFCSPHDFKIIVATDCDNYSKQTLAELLPNAFGPGELKH